MSVKSIEVSEDFYTDIKIKAERDNKSVSEELEYLVKVGREQAFKEYCVRQITIGEEQYERGEYITQEELEAELQAIINGD